MQGGLQMLDRSREVAEREGLPEQVARAFANAAWLAVRTRSYGRLDREIGSWLEYCTEHGLDLWPCSWTRSLLDRGH